jgi:hypothetical protein
MLLIKHQMDVYDKKILDLARYNGRIVLHEPDPKIRFAMMERVAARNKSTEFREALTGTLEENDFSKAYFSAENVQIIQNGIRAGVYERSGNKFTVAPQNIDQLKIIMRSYFLKFADIGTTRIREEIASLNARVLNYCVNEVYSAALSYRKYIDDISTLPVPLDKPKPVGRDYKILESKREMFMSRE